MCNLESKILDAHDILHLTSIIQATENNVLGQNLLNKIIYTNTFVRELNYCLNQNQESSSVRYTSSEDKIESDFTKLYDFVKQLCTILEERL